MLPENDKVALEYIAEKTGRFTYNEIQNYSSLCSNEEVKLLRELIAECSDYDYNFKDTYVQIILSQITHIILF